MAGYNYSLTWYCKCGDIEYSVFQSNYRVILMQYWDRNIPFEQNDWKTLKTVAYNLKIKKEFWLQHELEDHKKVECYKEKKKDAL